MVTPINSLAREQPLRAVEILLVEDNPGDVRLTREGLKDAKLLNTLHVVRDGLEAMAFLRNAGAYVKSPRPDLILLDLDLPRMDGREVMRQMQADPNLRHIPVVVLTGSRAEQDILRSYRFCVSSYVTKPVDQYQFRAMVQSLEDFWLAVVRVERSA